MNRNSEIGKRRGEGSRGGNRRIPELGNVVGDSNLKGKRASEQCLLLGRLGGLENRNIYYCILKCFCFCALNAICFPKCSVKCAATRQMLYVSRLWGSPGEGPGSMAKSARMGGPRSSRRLRGKIQGQQEFVADKDREDSHGKSQSPGGCRALQERA